MKKEKFVKSNLCRFEFLPTFSFIPHEKIELVPKCMRNHVEDFTVEPGHHHHCRRRHLVYYLYLYLYKRSYISLRNNVQIFAFAAFPVDHDTVYMGTWFIGAE